MRSFVKIVLTILFILYPVMIYVGFKHLVIEQIYLVITGLFILRFIVTRKDSNQITKIINFSTIFMIIICIIGYFLKKNELVRLYPILVNLSLAIVFVRSLMPNNVPVIETVARLHEKEFPLQAVHYTRNVTKIWLIFFIVNGSISAYTYFYSTLEIWALYNSLISYVLTGILFICEYSIRVILKKKWTPIDAT
jgi:uncharacterized membrane protein